MAQFDVYENLDADTREAYPFFIDLQNDLLHDLNTRVVAPLVLKQSFKRAPIQALCPVVRGIRAHDSNEEFVVMTHQLASIPLPANQVPVVSLKDQRYVLLNALDFLITGS
ncbi:CcdB family protein [Pseudidiomarina donghaiensis]|uniref:Toxin CcdB n=1 Tax=Pseudidiomarina donghaiensis TaxID=519452 RepID=A0A432XKM7_9GAMM|nr:CcdB family protein [Pseudidiomarina donghaiensis]RUO49253.1 plasmid maintenance protein CcdB [Pseudidiomarina donghaiensis]SFV20840.1 toxin CcdB [Pseudidiomarina donghaiensis]